MLEFKTLLISSISIIVFLGFALLFYQIKQKTYPGFSFWTAGTFLVSLAYIAMISRLYVPDWISIILTNTAMAMAAMLRLEGALRFLRFKSLNPKYYIIFALFSVEIIYFTLYNDQILLRNLSVSLYVASAAIILSIMFFSKKPLRDKSVYYAAAILYSAFGVLILTRAIWWFFQPDAMLLENSPLHLIYFFFVAILEVGWGLSFLMMNSQRLENELRDSEENLLATINKLETAIAEVKTLSGLLPICANCKNIRDDKGYWNQIETYLKKHSDAELSHSICPDCAKKLYPGLKQT